MSLMQQIFQVANELETSMQNKQSSLRVYEQLNQITLSGSQIQDITFYDTLKILDMVILQIDQSINTFDFNEQILLKLTVQLKLYSMLLKIMRKIEIQGNYQTLFQLQIETQQITLNILDKFQQPTLILSNKVNIFHIFIQTWEYFFYQLWKFLEQKQINETNFIQQSLLLYFVSYSVKSNRQTCLLKLSSLKVIFQFQELVSMGNFWNQFLTLAIQTYPEQELKQIISLFTIIVSFKEESDQLLLEIVKNLIKFNYFGTIKIITQSIIKQKENFLNTILKSLLEKFNELTKKQPTTRVIQDFYKTQLAFIGLITKNTKLGAQLFKKNLSIFSKQDGQSQSDLIESFLQLQFELFIKLQSEEFGQYLKQIVDQIMQGSIITSQKDLVYCNAILAKINGFDNISMKGFKKFLIQNLLKFESYKNLDIKQMNMIEQSLHQEFEAREEEVLGQEKIKNFQLIQKIQRFQSDINIMAKYTQLQTSQQLYNQFIQNFLNLD